MYLRLVFGIVWFVVGLAILLADPPFVRARVGDNTPLLGGVALVFGVWHAVRGWSERAARRRREWEEEEAKRRETERRRRERPPEEPNPEFDFEK